MIVYRFWCTKRPYRLQLLFAADKVAGCNRIAREVRVGQMVEIDGMKLTVRSISAEEWPDGSLATFLEDPPKLADVCTSGGVPAKAVRKLAKKPTKGKRRKARMR